MNPPSCTDLQGLLVDALAGGLDADGSRVLERHLLGCPGCREARAELAESWATFLELPPIEPPADVREHSRDAVLRLMALERDQRAAHAGSLAVDASAGPAAAGVGGAAGVAGAAGAVGVAGVAEATGGTGSGGRRREWLRVPLSVASALLVVLATMSLLSGVIWGSLLPEGHMFFCAAIFAGLLVGAFSWIYSATTVNGVHLDAAARTGVLALAITVAGTTACPMFNVLAWWKASVVGRFLMEDLAMGPGGSSLVFGVVYGLLPGFLAALFGGRMLDDRPLANGLVAAGVVFVLALPVIYLQSVPFTGGVVAAWIAGTAAGALCGVLGALRVRARVVRPV